MIVQDIQIVPHTLKDIFGDPEKKQRILKIIIQTLYNLGFEHSAAELERESKIIYMTPYIKAIKQALPKEDYAQVEQILKAHRLDLPELSLILSQLKCLKLMREGKTEEALRIIQENFSDQDKRAELAEELMLGTGKLSKQEQKKKHDFIIQKCLESDISPHSMEKMINSYIQLERQGLTQAISPEFSLLKKPALTKKPPMRMINVMTSSRMKNITFLKFNPKGDKLAVLSSDKKEKTISLWKVNKIDEEITETHYSGMLTEQEIAGVSWNAVSEMETLAVAFQSKIMVFSIPELKVMFKKKLSMGRHIRILTMEWNPMTEFLHVGGSFESIKVLSSSLEELMTIQPFFRTRKLCFSEYGTLMFAVSATRGQLISFNLFEQKQESSLICDDNITCFRLENGSRNALLVTEKSILYLSISYETPLQAFSVLNTFDNPYGANGLEIEAALFSHWVVLLGEHQFHSVQTSEQSEKVQKWNSKASFTFDVSDNFMVSGSKEIILWGSGSYQDAMEEERYHQHEDDQLRGVSEQQLRRTNLMKSLGLQMNIAGNVQYEQQDNFEAFLGLQENLAEEEEENNQENEEENEEEDEEEDEDEEDEDEEEMQGEYEEEEEEEEEEEVQEEEEEDEIGSFQFRE